MDDLSFTTILKFLGALFISLGGATAIILALARWFGNFMSQRLLDRFNNRHEAELEGLKNRYQHELEASKTELDKAKSLFLRYSEKQFELYNDLWRVLLYTKNQADSLWDKATPDKIPSFAEQIKLTRNAVNDNMLLIEEGHYNKLNQLITQFENFQFGKLRLIDIRDNLVEELEQQIVTAEIATATIEANREIKNKYDRLILEIGKTFRKQIKG